MSSLLLLEFTTCNNWQQLEILLRVEDSLFDINYQDEDFEGKAAIHWAASKVCLNDVNKLEQKMSLFDNESMDVDERDEDYGSRSPMHLACAKGHVRCCEILLEHDADPCLRMYQGWTPAHCAAENGHLEILTLLLQHNGTLFGKDDYGATPKDIARTYGHTACVNFLDTVENHPSQKRGIVKEKLVNAARRSLLQQEHKKT